MLSILPNDRWLVHLFYRVWYCLSYRTENKLFYFILFYFFYFILYLTELQRRYWDALHPLSYVVPKWATLHATTYAASSWATRCTRWALHPSELQCTWWASTLVSNAVPYPTSENITKCRIATLSGIQLVRYQNEKCHAEQSGTRRMGPSPLGIALVPA